MSKDVTEYFGWIALLVAGGLLGFFAVCLLSLALFAPASGAYDWVLYLAAIALIVVAARLFTRVLRESELRK